MRLSSKFAVSLAAIATVLLSSCAHVPPKPHDAPPGIPAELVNAPVAKPNPFLMTWTAFDQAAPYDKMTAEFFPAAFEAGMAGEVSEIAAIADNPAPPTFENTIVPLELSGLLLSRVASAFFHLTSADTNDDLQKLELELGPKLTSHSTKIFQNAALFGRIKTLYDARTSLNLTPEQIRLLERRYKAFIRTGAALDATGKARLGAIDEKLSVLSTTFGQNMLADSAASFLTLEKTDLEGLPESQIDAAAAAAKSKGLDGKYVITLARSSVEPFLQYSTRRDLREKAFKLWAARGDNNNQYDNKAIIKQMLELRLERAKLLGYPSHAAYVLDDTMAKTPDAAFALMNRVWKPARARALEERNALQKMMTKEGVAGKLAAWDWRFYSEKVRKAKFDLDEAELKPYLQLDSMIEGMFYLSNRLFGLTFTERKDIPVWLPDVRVWEVKDATGKYVGLYYGDFYSRPSKQSGAWMNGLRDQHRAGGKDIHPHVVNELNFARPKPGEPTLLSWDDAETLFHEFGHAQHGLLSNVTYPTLSGTAVSRDFVEFPSQVMERWLLEPEILSKFAIHYQTKQPMPPALIAKINKAKSYGTGFTTVEYLGSALVDMDMHMQTDYSTFDVASFEKADLTRLGMPAEIIMRHRPTHFSHLFNGGYSAGYYSYLWSEVLDADAYAAFKETGDAFNPALAAKFKEYIYASGNTRDPAESYRLFRGRDPRIDALLAGRGFR